MSKEVMKEPLLLRVRANGELDKTIRALLADGPLSMKELSEIGGLKRSGWMTYQLQKWFDNIRTTLTKGDEWANSELDLEYVDIAPKAPISIGTDVVRIEGDGGAKATTKPTEKVVWPQAPPLIESMGDQFDKPSWFETVRKMVKAERNISLESPPGMGKDTAVQELAAQEGIPLVTVSGDGGFRRRDLVGTAELRNGSSFFQVAEYAAAAVNGWWVLITEVNAADADALLFINSQLAPPNTINIHGKAYPVHPNFRLFVTYNAGLIGTKPLPPAFKDRFFPIKIGFFDESKLTRRLRKWDLPHITVAGNHSTVRGDDKVTHAPWAWAVVQFGLRMHKANVDGKMRYQITVRRLIDTVQMMHLGVTSDVFKALRQAVISTIDSPIENRAAEQVLGELRQDYRMRYPSQEDFGG